MVQPHSVLQGEQFSFNTKIYDHLSSALECLGDDSPAANELSAGMVLLDVRNKQLKIADKHGWLTAEAYQRDPIADDSGDEKRLKQALKEGRRVKEEKAKANKAKKSSGKKPFRPYIRQPPLFCWKCQRPGHIARFCHSNAQPQQQFRPRFGPPGPPGPPFHQGGY